MSAVVAGLRCRSLPRVRLNLVRTSVVLCASHSAPARKLARAVKPVKIRLVTVSKGNDRGTELVSGTCTLLRAVLVPDMSQRAKQQSDAQETGQTRSEGIHSWSIHR